MSRSTGQFLKLVSLSVCWMLLACSAKFNNPASPPLPERAEVSLPGKLLFGKPDFNSLDNMEKGLISPNGVFSDGTRLVVADTSLHRVLIYNSIPTQDYPSPNVVLGVPSLKALSAYYGNAGGVSESSLNTPVSAYIDGNRLYVADTGNNRVLIWNSIPTSHMAPANIVLGQANFNTGFANRGQSSPSADTLNSPRAILVVGSKLLVSDSANNRVLIWNDKNSISNGSPADIAIGQTTLSTATAAGAASTTLRAPRGLASDGTKLLIADFSFNRVLIYNSIPTTSGAAANYVLGQTNFTTITANAGGLSSSSLRSPQNVTIVSGKVYVTDNVNHRVLVWNSIPSSNKPAASLVIGQTSFTSSSCNMGADPNLASSASLCSPVGIASDGSRLYVADTNNHRISIWNQLPISSGASADLAVGQPSLNGPMISYGSPTTVNSFNRIYDTSVGGGRLIVSVFSENRVLIWNQIPKSSQTPPDLVLGQPDFNSFATNNEASGTPSARSMSFPRGAWSDGTRLAIPDQTNHRVLIWNQFPKQSYTPADIVLGQPDFVSTSANAGGTVSAKSLNSPQYLTSDGTKLVVADVSNHRVLIWNTFPTVSYTPADVVIGQPNMTSNTANNGGISAKSVNTPYVPLIDSGKLILNDNGNYRILIWNEIPTQNFTSADIVLGQPDFTTNRANYGNHVNLSNFGVLRGLAVNRGRFYAFGENGKIQVWNKIPTSNFASADWMYGMLSGTFYDISEYTIQNGPHIAVTDDYIFAPDAEGARLLGLPHYPVGFYTYNITSQPTGKLTAVDCSDSSAILVNEGLIPSAKDASWQACDTKPGAISFTLANSTEGVHLLKVWMKNLRGQVKSEPVVLPLGFDTTPPLASPIRVSSANPSSSASVTLTLATCVDTPHVFISEDNSAPSADSSNWQSCASSMSFQLGSQTGGTHTLYLWGKDRAGNISRLPSTTSVVY